MSTLLKDRTVAAGALLALGADLCFSVNDVLIKFLSGGYPLYQLIFLRALVSLVLILAVLLPVTGSFASLRTKRPLAHAARGLFVVFANFCFFLGLAALPLAEAVAIFFVSPLLIAVASVIFLGERVGPLRWGAIAVGLLGVLIVLRPGTEAFRPAALLPLAAAGGYAGLHIMTRRIGGTENAASLTVSVQLAFLLVAGTAGLFTADGRFDVYDHPSLDFLFRAWVWPPAGDFGLILLVGLMSALGGTAISEAYRRSEAALVAPFEYSAMPLAVFWGLVVFGEWPDGTTWAGIGLILLAGLFFIWREAVARRRTLDAAAHLRA